MEWNPKEADISTVRTVQCPKPGQTAGQLIMVCPKFHPGFDGELKPLFSLQRNLGGFIRLKGKVGGQSTSAESQLGGDVAGVQWAVVGHFVPVGGPVTSDLVLKVL
jgi:hypothetical protein